MKHLADITDYGLINSLTPVGKAFIRKSGFYTFSAVLIHNVSAFRGFHRRFNPLYVEKNKKNRYCDRAYENNVIFAASNATIVAPCTAIFLATNKAKANFPDGCRTKATVAFDNTRGVRLSYNSINLKTL